MKYDPDEHEIDVFLIISDDTEANITLKIGYYMVIWQLLRVERISWEGRHKGNVPEKCTWPQWIYVRMLRQAKSCKAF